MWLADRTVELGHPISRTAISEYETGKRKAIPITDLIVISAALEVPAARLLYPELPDGEVEVTPGRTRTSIDALMLFSGELIEMPSVTEQSDSYLPREEWLKIAEAREQIRKSAELIRLSRERRQLEDRIASLTRDARNMHAHGVAYANAYDATIDAARHELNTVADRLANMADATVHSDDNA